QQPAPAPVPDRAGPDPRSRDMTELAEQHAYGYTKDKEALVKRLHRIEGQVRGIERMVEDDRIEWPRCSRWRSPRHSGHSARQPLRPPRPPPPPPPPRSPGPPPPAAPRVP